MEPGPPHGPAHYLNCPSRPPPPPSTNRFNWERGQLSLSVREPPPRTQNPPTSEKDRHLASVPIFLSGHKCQSCRSLIRSSNSQTPHSSLFAVRLPIILLFWTFLFLFLPPFFFLGFEAAPDDRRPLGPGTMARRQPLTLMVFLALAAFFSVSYLFSSSPRKAYEYEPGPVPVRAHEPAPAPEAAPQAVPEVAPLAKDSTLSSLQSTHDDHDDHDAHDDHDDTSDDEEHHHSDEDGHDSGVDLSQIDSKILKGESIAPKLENATARYFFFFFSHDSLVQWQTAHHATTEPNSAARPGNSSTP